MKIVLLDDEPILLREGENAVRAAVPDAEIRSFSLGADLLSAIETEGLKPDVVFTDIEMPGISGLELAVRVKSLCPDTRIVFVTGYSQYAVEAFRLRAHGYVMKPLTRCLSRRRRRPTVCRSAASAVSRCFSGGSRFCFPESSQRSSLPFS